MSKDTVVYNTLETSEEACDDKAEISKPSSKDAHKAVRRHRVTNVTSTHRLTAVKLMRRIGPLPWVILISGNLGILAFTGYITFLWFAADHNTTWKNIAISGWITTSIAIAAALLRSAITAQAGIACSMIAGILLESYGTFLPKLAVVSIMRSASPAPHTLFRHIFLGTNPKNWMATALAAVLTLTTVFLQFTSTALLADVSTGLVAGYLKAYPIMVPINVPQGGTSKWNVGVRDYPTFAEYAEPTVANGASGISDTGLTLRAFLPIDDQGNRSSIHRYEGPATVANVRTICVRPNITILNSHLVEFNNDDKSGSLEISGYVSIPADLLKEAAVLEETRGTLQNFTCSTSHITRDKDRKYDPSNWELSVCQMGNTGAWYLNNAWATMHSSGAGRNTSVPAYLLVNLTSMPTPREAVDSSVDFLKLQSMFNDSWVKLVHQDRNDWTDVYPTSNYLSASTRKGKLSFSLCFPLSQTRYVNIIASSTVPPVQPRFIYDSNDKRIRFDDVRKQMLSRLNATTEQRGILSLQLQDWINMSEQIPPYLNAPDTGIAMKVDPYEENMTANLLQKYERPGGRADISIGGLLLEILREGGTTAEAVQSMMTTLLASRYQDYVFLGGKGDAVNATRADFVAVQVPGGSRRLVNCAAGATRSFVLVMVAITVHVLTVSIVVVWFCTVTHATYLLESWSSISQVYSEMTVPYFKRAAFARDWEVETWMEHKRLHKEAIVIERSSAIQRAPSIAGSVKARKGFVRVEETECEQDFTSETRSSQASQMEMASLNERERRSSISSCSEVSIDSRDGDLGFRQ